MLLKKALIPMLWVLPIGYLWYTGKITWGKAVLLNLSVGLCYLIYQLVRYQVFAKIIPKVEIFPGVTYYYKEYQCDCRSARTRLIDEFTTQDRQRLEQLGGWANLYFENPFELEDTTKGRCTLGYAIPVGGKAASEVEEILGKLNLRKVELKPCEVVTVSMKVVDELTYFIAAIKTMNPLWDFVENTYKEVTLEMEQTPMLEWIYNGSITFAPLPLSSCFVLCYFVSPFIVRR